MKKEQVRRRIERLAGSKVNDAVRLAFLDAKGLKELGKMDLSAVAEFKRSSAGTVEIKFVDRLEALKWLAETEEGPREGGHHRGAGEKRGGVEGGVNEAVGKTTAGAVLVV